MDVVNQFRRNVLLQDESQLVGTQEPKRQLIDWLLNDESHLKVVAVTGMGGLGKTTLVQQIYNNDKVNAWFQGKALVTISQSLKQEEIFKELIRQLSPEQLPQGIDAMDNYRLKQTTKELLHDKRYLIVLDDVWKMEDWDQLRVAMPTNNYGSRVIITTRITEVANYSTTDQGMIYNMPSLSESDSWTLFCTKTFQAESCPPHLKDNCELIIKKCGGIPLAISTVSGLLAAKGVESVGVWKMILDGLSIELQENSHLQMMQGIFSLSFHDLPYYLKSCFLCLSIFPEDYLIERTRLVRLWIAQGFIKEKDGRTMEEVAESYFYELLNRSLIQAAITTYDGRIKSCRIHDFLREAILSKSNDENFVQVLSKEKATKLPEGARRLSILHLDHQVDMYQFKSSSLSKLRSLFLFGAGSSSTMSELLSGGFKLLKVLDLEDAPLDTCPEQVSTLFLLRYLSLRNTKMSRLDLSIGNLHSLETLDLRQTYVTELPSEIYKLHKLRNLLICRSQSVGETFFVKVEKRGGRSDAKLICQLSGLKVSKKIGGLVSWQKLCYVDASEEEDDVILELGRVVQLRRLCLINVKGQHGSVLCSSISKMQCLSYLSLHWGQSETMDLQGMSSPPRLLKRLHLNGPLVELPSWVSSLQYLEVLHLMNSQLKEDPLKSLHSLPCLIDLLLCDALMGEVIFISPGGFPRLNCLGIWIFHTGTTLLIFPNAIPRLESIDLWTTAGRLREDHPSVGKNWFINDSVISSWCDQKKNRSTILKRSLVML